MMVGRRTAAFVVVITLFVVLYSRFYVLQVQHHESYLERSERNRVREIPVEPPRGLIVDRLGNILVDNRPSYVVSVIPWEIRQTPTVVPLLARYLSEDRDNLASRVEANSRGAFLPVKIKAGIDLTLLSVIDEHRLELPGVVFGIEPERFYPAQARVTHLLGYLREISEEDLKARKGGDYRRGDLVGWNGVERYYESHLRGKRGFRYVQVDALGRELGELPDDLNVSPQPGDALILSVDLDLQAEAERLMRGRKGAVVALDPATGEVLTLVSMPDYPPNIFAGQVSADTWKKLLEAPEHPLYNRATQSGFPPGSTLKLVVAAAAIEEGLIDLQYSVTCNGSFRLGRRQFKCWKSEGHGRVNLLDAIEQSCNVFFYTLGLELGLDSWARYAQILGFGRPSGVDLPEDNPGILPTRAYLDRKLGDGRWTRGDILNLVIGQGDLSVTPLQMAVFAMIIANRGVVVAPRVALGTIDWQSGEERPFPVRISDIQGISESTYDLVREGMFLVVNGENGTGRAARLENRSYYGKTGSAQNPHGDDHAWFIGFVEDDVYPLALAIIVENGGAGGATAAPMARRLAETYYSSHSQELARLEE